MKYFSLGDYFKSLYSIDLNIGSPFQNKTQMIGGLVMDYKIDPDRALYIGDRVDDYHSAIANNMDCLLVGWGYGTATSELYGHSLVDSPSDLYARISSF
jgi:phosphoglycolate phosphatase-like HAD superfamily hydrolase